MARRGENIFKRKDGRWEARVIACRHNGKSVYRWQGCKSAFTNSVPMPCKTSCYVKFLEIPGIYLYIILFYSGIGTWNTVNR